QSDLRDLAGPGGDHVIQGVSDDPRGNESAEGHVPARLSGDRVAPGQSVREDREELDPDYEPERRTETGEGLHDRRSPDRPEQGGEEPAADHEQGDLEPRTVPASKSPRDGGAGARARRHELLAVRCHGHGRPGPRGSNVTGAGLALAKEPEELPTFGQESLPLRAVRDHTRDLATYVARAEVEPSIEAVNALEDSLGW